MDVKAQQFSGPVRGLGMIAMCLLVGCASTGPAPVEDRNRGHVRPAASSAPAPARGSYRVQRADTLYSIAFRNGLDFRDLAGWNGIRAPYTIYPGQELRLSSGVSPPARVASTSSGVATVPARTAPVAPPKSAPAPFESVAAAPASSAPLATSAGSVTTPAAPPASAGASAAAAPVLTTPPPPAAAGQFAWRWPADGKIINGYVAGDQTRQGLDIAGNAGDAVRAAADGVVVYSGNGLIGYGELIIIKHNATYLSAYGHNRKRLLKEGDAVKAGQPIAEMGSTSASRQMLHFEIRKNGKPANPLDFLPRR